MIIRKQYLMLVAIMLIIGSCGVSDKAIVRGNDLFMTNPPIYHEIVLPKQAQTDTIKRQKKDPQFQDRINKFLDRSDKAFSSIDEILAINIEWQKRYMRVSDTARNRKKGKDSLYLLLSVIRDTVNAANKRADKFQSEAKKANYFADQIKKADTAYNWQFYTAFGILLTFVCINTYQTYKNGSKKYVV